MLNIPQKLIALQAGDLPRLIGGKPELPPKPLWHEFSFHTTELFMRNRSLEYYGEEAHSVPNRVFRLARKCGVPWREPKSCFNAAGVHQGLLVVFSDPSKEFWLGLKKLGWPMKGSFVISRLDPKWDLTYDRGEAKSACLQLQRGWHQKYNRTIDWQVGFSSYGGKHDSSRNRDVYLKTDTLVRVELRIQKPQAVERLGLNDPARLAAMTSGDFVELFDRLISWQPFTVNDFNRIAMKVTKPWHIDRTMMFVERGWLHGRSKLTFSEVLHGWQLPASVPSQLVE
jgi:hypothetical protein